MIKTVLINHCLTNEKWQNKFSYIAKNSNYELKYTNNTDTDTDNSLF